MCAWYTIDYAQSLDAVQNFILKLDTLKWQAHLKTKPVIIPDEVQWLTNLGLGRGVDATKLLWKEKSSFQVPG